MEVAQQEEEQRREIKKKDGDRMDERHIDAQKVYAIKEKQAESSISDIDGDDVPVSAYGDQISFVSLERKASWLTLSTVSNLNIHIQTSLIYSKDMMYVAGKIIEVDGLTFVDKNAPVQVKVHVVVLPIKKYAIKTNWYDIQHSKVRINEYFKFKFKSPPSESKTMFRMRAYGRKINRGVFGRDRCLGECFINLNEIVIARGGLTVWRSLTRGVPESIFEEEK